MARSDDPTTFTQTWQDAPQSYGEPAPQPQYAQPSYEPQPQSYAQYQPAETGGAAYYDPTQASQQAAPQSVAPESYAPVTQQPLTEQAYQDPAAPMSADTYPPLNNQMQGYEPAPAPQTYQAQPTTTDFGSPLDTAVQPQTYQSAASFGTAEQTGQPASYQYADPVTQPAEPLQPHAHYGEPAPNHLQTYAQPALQPSYADAAHGYAETPDAQPSVVYTDYTAPTAVAEQTAPADPYAPFGQQAQHDPLAQQQPMTNDPVTGEAGFAGAAPQEPSYDAGQQMFANPTADPYGFPGQTGVPHGVLAQAEAQGGFAGQGHAPVLDPTLFTQPDVTQPHSVGQNTAFAPATYSEPQFHDAQVLDPTAASLGDPHGGIAAAGAQAGYDQRFDPQAQGYDQRFEQPQDGYFDNGQMADFGQPGEQGVDGIGEDMAPVVAGQEVEASRGRRGLIVVGALVAAVGIGGALGFAYKYSNDTGGKTAGSPPTIKASKTAAKQKPASTNGQAGFDQDDIFGTRLASNRAADKSRTRVVSREEPLAGQAGADLRRTTSGQTASNETRVSTLQGTSRSNNVSGVRKVKTLRVNPDGTFAAPTPSSIGGADNSIPGLTIGSIPAAKKVTSKRINVQDALAAKRTTRTASASLPKLSAQIPAPQPVQPRKQVARLAPATPTAVSTGGGGLGYVVQVSARRSRIDALAAFADLQQRYTSALSSKQPDIQEVNLGGTRGKWYRVRIGPPGSKNAAYNLCNRLKRSGLKDCLIKAY